MGPELHGRDRRVDNRKPVAYKRRRALSPEMANPADIALSKAAAGRAARRGRRVRVDALRRRALRRAVSRRRARCATRSTRRSSPTRRRSSCRHQPLSRPLHLLHLPKDPDDPGAWTMPPDEIARLVARAAARSAASRRSCASATSPRSAFRGYRAHARRARRDEHGRVRRARPARSRSTRACCRTPTPACSRATRWRACGRSTSASASCSRT